MWTLCPCSRRLILKNHLLSNCSSPMSRVSGEASALFGEILEFHGVGLGFCSRASALCCVRPESSPLTPRSQEPSETKCGRSVSLSGFTGFQDCSLHPLYIFFSTFNQGFPQRTLVEWEINPRIRAVDFLVKGFRALAEGGIYPPI